MKKRILIIFVFILNGCGAGWSDVFVELGNGYVYYGEGSPMNSIFYGEKSKHGYSIKETVVVPNIIDYKFNDNYIIILQKPNYEANVQLIISEPFFSESQLKSQKKEADSIIQNNPYWQKIFENKMNYYIIDKNGKNTYGPYSKSEFKIKKKEFGITLDFKAG